MSSMSIKELSSMMSRNLVSATGGIGKQADAVSFESVWSNQTEKNDSPQMETDNNSIKSDDVSVRDSLKAKEVRRSSVKDTEQSTTRTQEEMSPEELEQAMETLGTAAVRMVEQIAEEFGMSVEEVQQIMSELGMEQMDVLQQGKLAELLLAVAGVEDSMSLLTDGELYQKYQNVMEQLNICVEQCSEELQISVETVEELVTVEEEAPVEVDQIENMPSTEQTDALKSVDAMTEQSGQQMQNRTDSEEASQNTNLLLQNLKQQNFEPQLQQITETTLAWDEDTMDIMKQIMDYMKVQVKPDMSHLEMQLHPENLGTLQVNVAAKDGVVTAQFVTQNETVKAVLESQMIQLKESFAEQGVKVEAVEVTVQTHQFGQNLEQGREGQFAEQSGDQKKSRPRRIQLDDVLSMDAMDELEEDEKLAAQMMLANGNTVDYTA